MKDFKYECIYCGTKIQNKEDLYYHLKLTHTEVSLINRKEILKDFQKKISRYEKKKPSKWHLGRAERSKKSFQGYQNNILTILQKADCKNEYLQLVKNSNSIEELRNNIKDNFDNENISIIEESGYKINIPKAISNAKKEKIKKIKKKKKAKVKSKLLKNYYDKSENSIWAIKTPMGKR